ncbi:hypothetical protein [Sulfurisoma sediminicola]|uniref:Uncharacterized protein n=1 Tax=Sulfurisoma sediminicola TaxID=1381557 RepID=A0A497X6T0_9PROT|nr:hypothetical protein [Sulfurisoma sediminicola]RLJ61234.1 hypothetical protein DFR35_2913 [Sulfurisoma sediminicola]
MIISPIGIVLIAIYSAIVVVVLALPLRKLLARFRWKWAAIAPPVAVLLALPWAEEAWIAWHFKQACTDAGVHVGRKVEVEGFVDDTSRTPRNQIRKGNWNFDAKSLADWDARGYRYKENMLTDGGVVHLERTPEGIVASILDQPTARYHYKHAYQPTPHKIEEPIGWRLEKIEWQVVDSATGEVLGRNTLIKRRASTVERLWIRLLGSDLTICPDPDSGPKQQPFLEAVLVPAIKR